MATFAAQGTLPAAGATMEAAPLTDTFNHIINTINGNNLDRTNVDYTSTDGIMVVDQDQTITSTKSWENTAAAAGGVREVAQFGIDPGSGTAADNDGGRLTFYADDDGGNETDIARFDWVLTDASNTTEDGRLDWSVMTAGTLASELQLSGASLNPTTDAGLTLGTASLRWGTVYADTLGDTGQDLAVAATTLSFGAASTIDTSGNNNLTLSAGTADVVITASDLDVNGNIDASGSVTVGVDGTGHDVKFFGDTSGQYMLWDQSEDELVLTGDSKLSFHDAAGGENIIATSDGHLEVNAGTTLDITAPTVDLNSSTEFNIDTAAYDLNASGAVTIDSAGASIDSSAASNFTTSGGALTLTSAVAATWSTSAGALTVNGTGGINIQEGGADIITISDARALATANTASISLDASGVVAIESSGGTISVGDDNVDQTINLATKGTRTLNIGINDGTDVTTLAVKGNTTNTGTITVGADDTGYDVKFFGATSGNYMLWDEDADSLLVSGDIDMVTNGNRIDLDTDNDTSIRASADDTISIELAGADDFTITANSFNVLTGSVIDLADNAPIQFGDADDASIKFDATNTVIATAAQLVLTPTTDTIFSNGTGVVVGHTAQMTAGGVAQEMQILGTGAADSQMVLGRFSADAAGPILTFAKSRDPAIFDGSFAIVADDDQIGAIYATVDDGTDFAQIVASINFVVDDASPAENATGGSIEFHTMNASGTSRNVAVINKDGEFQVPNASGDTITSITAAHTWVGVLSASGGNHVNTESNYGVTVNQGGDDLKVLTFKSSDVAHGITARGETDTFMAVAKNGSATGGAMFRTFTENKQSFGVLAYYTTDDTAKTTSADGPIALWTHKKSGTSSGAPGSNANQLVVGDYSNGAQFIVDAEGDLFANGSATTVYDDRDDMALLSAFDRDSKGFIEQDWERNLAENEKALIDIGILGGPRVNVPAKERGLINYTGLARLHNSALRQVYTQLVETVKRLDLAESKLKMLGA